ncbi:hypothetical protein BT69DRAFT_1286530 [Atractiella rhizophila]|nr:hypothetical protein BT69DRAFT_1286530 [Atractiella rhizophila]
MEMETQPPDSLEDNFCGKILIPTIVSMIVTFVLWGIGVLQFYRCFRIISTTPRNIVIAIELYILFILDISDSIAKIVWFARFLRDTISCGSLGFLRPDRSIIVLQVTGPLIAVSSHLLYARRIHSIRKGGGSKHITFWSAALITAVLLSILHYVAALITGYISITMPSDKWIPSMIPSASVELALSASLDCILCFFFVLALRKHCLARGDCNLSTNNTTVFRIIYFAIVTNVVTASLCLLELVLLLSFPETTFHIAVLLITPNVYVYGIVILIVGGRPNQTSSEEIWPVGIPYEIRLNRQPAQGIKRMGQDVDLEFRRTDSNFGSTRMIEHKCCYGV